MKKSILIAIGFFLIISVVLMFQRRPMSQNRGVQNRGLHLELSIYSQRQEPETTPRTQIGGFELILPMRRVNRAGKYSSYLRGFAALADGSKVWGIWRVVYERQESVLSISPVYLQYMESPNFTHEAEPVYERSLSVFNIFEKNISFPCTIDGNGVWCPVQPIVDGVPHSKAITWKWRSEGLVDISSLKQKVNNIHEWKNKEIIVGNSSEGFYDHWVNLE